MSAGVRTEGARSLVYGLGLLRAFDGEHPVRSISELADILGVSRPTVHRYAVTFLELGFLEQAPMRRYRLAPGAAQLGVAMVDSLAVVGRARPVVRRLRESTGATVSLAVLDGQDVVYLLMLRGYLQGSYELAKGVGAGSRVPAQRAPAGLALTAWRERQAQDARQGGGEADRGHAQTRLGQVEIHRSHGRAGAGGLAIVVDDGAMPAALEMIVPAQIAADERTVAGLAERLGRAAARLSAPRGRRRD